MDVELTAGDAALLDRGNATLAASWEAYARGSTGAAVLRLPGVVAAVFPREPQRSVYNNALIEPRPGAVERGEAIDALEEAYAAAGVDRYAAWVHEGDAVMRIALERRGYTIDTATRAMGMQLGEVRAPRSPLPVARADWPAYLAFLSRSGFPDGLLADVDPAAFHVVLAGTDGDRVSGGLAYDLGDDCGIYNVATLEHARRRGLASAVTVALLRGAQLRGRRTATLQASAMAERLYRSLGFRDLGRLLEYVPAR